MSLDTKSFLSKLLRTIKYEIAFANPELVDLMDFFIHTPPPRSVEVVDIRYHSSTIMEESPASRANPPESPDPSSHAANVYDAVANESDWLDEVDDDDMDLEPPTDESEDIEFFDPAEMEEDEDTEYHGAGSQLALLETSDWNKTGS